MIDQETDMIGIYIYLPKRRKRGLENCWKIKKFQSRRSCIRMIAIRKRSLKDYWKIKKFQIRRICINLSAGRKRECKNSPFFILKKYKIFNFGDWQYK